MTSEAEARDHGAALALEAEARKFELESAITWAARRFREFTSDDIHAWLEKHELGLDHPNAMGGAFLCASRAGVIENTGRVQKSSRPGAHRRAVAVWKSLKFENLLDPKPAPSISRSTPWPELEAWIR